MLNPTPTAIRPTAYLGNAPTLQGLNQTATDNIPLARKIENHQGPSELLVMGGGAAFAKALGTLLHGLCEPTGPIVQFSKTLSDKTVGFNNWFTNLKIGEKVSKVLTPIKDRLFTSANLDTFNKGFKANGGLVGTTKFAMETAKNNLDSAMKITDAAKKAKAVAKATTKLNTAEAIYKSTAGSVAKLNTMGVVGKTFGKTALFLRKHLNGGFGLMNGLFAAMTINGVLKAKEGEKFSTFMQDFLGSWIGSFGGFTLFGKIAEGLSKFVNPATGKVAAKGVLPTIAKVVNKLPWKTMTFPLIGSILLSTVLQKVSHALFGKPTEEAKEANKANETATAGSTESMSDFFNKTGWDKNAFNEVRNNQQVNVPVANTPVQTNETTAKQETPQTNGYQGYMPQTEIPAVVATANDEPTKALFTQVDQTIADMQKDLSRLGIKI